MILGTAAYMAPEQAKGKHVDKRADVWAFGVVLFEMLTGQRPFDGSDVSEVMARVLKEQPDFEALPPIPERLRTLLERLLQKDPKLRLRDVGDARLELEASQNEPARARVAAAGGLSWRVASAVAAVVLLAGLGLGWLARGGPQQPPERRTILATESTAAGTDALAVAPDGALVAEGGPTGIRVRAMDDPSWRSLPDTGVPPETMGWFRHPHCFQGLPNEQRV